MITNIVVALMIVSTNYVPVRAIVDASPRYNSIGLFEGYDFHMEDLFRAEADTNFVFVSKLEHRTKSEYKPGDIENIHWVRFCDCPCHNGNVEIHERVKKICAPLNPEMYMNNNPWR